MELPSDLAALRPDETAKVRVNRRQIFERSDGVQTPADAMNLYVLMCGWGAGIAGRSVARSMKPLSQPGVADKLFDSHQAIRAGMHPVEAYDQLRRGAHQIKYFGPAFFTKWIYFAGYEVANDLRPLILDRQVAAGLNWATTGWTATQYGEYLGLAARLAQQMHTTPHVIEHALFSLRSRVRVEGRRRSVTVDGLSLEVIGALRANADRAGVPLGRYVAQIAEADARS